MKIFQFLGLTATLGWAVQAGAGPAAASPGHNAFVRWKHGPPTDASFFPIAVWLQSPRNAARYKAAGIDLYIGLWRGPTTAQLDALRKAGMPVICAQNQVGLAHKDDPIIVGWMHGDEPDNAQPRPHGRGYGPPIPPAKIVKEYQQMRAADPTRPIWLNLGQGVAWDDYIGRGVRRNHPEDYPRYIQGCDVVSFDIYPVVHDSPVVAGKLQFVAKGVRRLVRWSHGRKIVWNCIECTHISNPTRMATPQQVREEVWMALISGSQGIIYFVHQFKPTFVEAALLAEPKMLAAVTAINRQIHELAPVLNSPTIPDGATVHSSAPDVPIACLVKRWGGSIYVFAVSLRNRPTHGSFAVRGVRGAAQVEVLGESRHLDARNGKFADAFRPYAVHLYRLQEAE